MMSTPHTNKWLGNELYPIFGCKATTLARLSYDPGLEAGASLKKHV